MSGRRNGLCFWALLAVFGFAVQLSLAVEPTVEKAVPEGNKAAPAKGIESVLVSNNFFDTPLRQVLSDLSAQCGVTIVSDMTVQGLVTCELKDVPILRALDIVLGGSNCEYRQLDGFILVGTNDAKSPVFDKLCETDLVVTNYVSGSEAMKMLPANYSPYVKASPEGNAVLVTAPAKLRERVITTIKMIDRPPRHVMLSARVVVLEHTGLLDLGTQWSWPQLTAGTFSSSDLHGTDGGVAWPWGLQIGYTSDSDFTDALAVKLNLLEQNNEATIIASPRLMAQDHKEAEIKATTEEYFEIVSGGVYEQIELETIETGTTFKILPTIGENGDITLSMEVEVSDVVARGQDDLPVVTRRRTANTVRVQDGGTVAIAGLSSAQLQRNREEVPGAARLPGLGRAFKNDSSSYSSREVAVFITASLVPEGQMAPPTMPEAKAAFEPTDVEAFRKELKKSLEKLKAATSTPSPKRHERR